jgi:hypothetical protein
MSAHLLGKDVETAKASNCYENEAVANSGPLGAEWVEPPLDADIFTVPVHLGGSTELR